MVGERLDVDGLMMMVTGRQIVGKKNVVMGGVGALYNLLKWGSDEGGGKMILILVGGKMMKDCCGEHGVQNWRVWKESRVANNMRACLGGS